MEVALIEISLNLTGSDGAPDEPIETAEECVLPNSHFGVFSGAPPTNIPGGVAQPDNNATELKNIRKLAVN